jgi:hypothetical protein
MLTCGSFIYEITNSNFNIIIYDVIQLPNNIQCIWFILFGAWV